MIKLYISNDIKFQFFFEIEKLLLNKV